MIIVIIAGGSGTRLWPLSTPEYPKHLLSLNGDDRSLLQLTYDRAKKITDKIYIVTDGSHIEPVKKQLIELPNTSFIVEPGRRGTANCIVAALEQIEDSIDSNETIATIHADHSIRDINGFIHTLKTADKITSAEKRIVLIGVEPDYPATGFGYIMKGKILSEEPYVYNVESFKEKPDFNTARNYIRSGDYLWNCGYFVGSLNTFKESMKQYSKELYSNYTVLKDARKDNYKEVYLGFKSEAIDYALIEKVPDLLVIPASYDWMDLGSYSDLHKAVGSDEKNNYISGNVELEEVENAYIRNENGIPLAVIGLDNIVVISTDNGILVTRKDLSQKVGDVSKRINGK
ncbi:MAG: sugar phosphate nucleotidyltransferase [Candidatus Saccharibacteria bacterium]